MLIAKFVRLVDEKFAKEIYANVNKYLRELIDRYKEWDTTSDSA